MSGHSKWHSIKHKKAAKDAKRGKLFTKLIKDITVAARDGGGDPDLNPRLRRAIEKAKAANMPADNIERAIKKGTGELPGVTYESVIYEGYGPSGVAILVYAYTDNKNRTVAEIRHIFSKKGGSLAGAGSVAWQFNKKGLIVVDKDQINEDDLLEVVLEAGAEDMKTEGSFYEIYCDVSNLESVRQALDDKGIKYQSADITMLPTTTVRITDEHIAKQILNLMETLEDHDDVENVYSNFDIPEEIMEKISSQEG